MTAAGNGWMRDAPCFGDLRFAPAEGPDSSRFVLLARAHELLRLCQGCPFRVDCVVRVKPSRSGLDGVCGGHLWIDGVPVASAYGIGPDSDEPPLRASCGTPAGARAHSRHGDGRACDACREAQRVYQRERRRRLALEAAEKESREMQGNR
ncbi:hypothetical protein AB0K51_09515 [Kitasatospora sp. NPDC049285]|uniref:hypothetical protein n=1 Tax=Kitasatospora sp. NPDC049285 TaxID=3157096 RepID=UPI0034385E0A